MKIVKLPNEYWDKILSGQIRVWCKHCEDSTWHVKKSDKRDKWGYAGVRHIFYVCEVCNNVSPYFNSWNQAKHAMHEYKKTGKRVTCPKCRGRFFYSYTNKRSKCKKCGFELPLNAVIEI